MTMKYIPAYLVALISAADAQVALNADLYTTYTDNVFLTANQRGDFIQSAYIDFDYQFDADLSLLSLYYSGSANVFSQNADLFNHLHRLGASYARPLGAAGLVFAGTALSLRLDRPLYDYRSFAAGQAFVSFYPSLYPELISRLDYTLSYQNFLSAADYNYLEQQLDAKLTHSLPTRTTLQLNGELGLKSTAEPNRHLLRWGTRLKAAQSLGPNLGLQLAWHHRRSLADQLPQAEYDPDKLLARYSYYEEQLLAIRRSLADKLTQAEYDPDKLFTDRYRYYEEQLLAVRHSLANQLPHAGYDLDDPFYDLYSYGGDQWSATLKYLAPLNCELAASFHRESRRYSQRPAYDLTGALTGESMAETRHTARLGLARTFYPASTPIREMALELEWLYRTVASNDAFYDANAQAYSVGIQFGF